MNVEEKKIKSRQFIAEEFTLAAHSAIALFHHNVQNLSNVFRLEGIFLEKIEKGEVDAGLSAEEQSEVKNFVLLDGLAKIMMVIEGFFALCEAVSNPKKGYRHLARSMAYYPTQDINDFIERLKRQEVNLRTLFRFPDAAKLKLESEELVFIEKKFNDSCQLLEKTIREIVEFYECNRIAYNKFKHGLSIIAGMKMTPKDPVEGEFPSMLLYALQRSGKREPPCLCHKSKESFMPEGLEWYDTVSIIPHWANTFKKYGNMMINAVLMVEHVTQNHLDWASNCGEDYFPLKWMGKGQYRPILYLPYKLEGSDKEMHERIVSKIVSNMNIAEKTFKWDFNITGEVMEKIFACFAANQVATLWGPPKAVSSARVEVE